MSGRMRDINLSEMNKDLKFLLFQIEMNMINLPTEVIENIVVSLDMKTLILFSHVCTRFREVVVTRHFQNYLTQQVSHFGRAAFH